MAKPRPDLGKTAFRPAQRRVFRRLCQAGIRRARTGDAMGGDRRTRDRQTLRAAEDPVAAAGRGPAAGTGHAGAAGGRSRGAGNPARLRHATGAGQSLLRLERGRPAGAAAGATVAPGATGVSRILPTPKRWRKSPKRFLLSRTRNCGPRWRGSAPRSSEIEAAAWSDLAARHCHNCGFKLANTFLHSFRA